MLITKMESVRDTQLQQNPRKTCWPGYGNIHFQNTKLMAHRADPEVACVEKHGLQVRGRCHRALSFFLGFIPGLVPQDGWQMQLFCDIRVM